MGGIDFWGLTAGLGLFIFSMNQLEACLKQLAGSSFKTLLRKNTNHPIKAILSGTVATAVLQSSSIVTLMLLALVGAGLLDLRNAIGVVLGSNLGTTFTGWIVSYLGFKVSFSELILPLLAIGSIGQAFLPKGRWFYGCQLVFYMALLFWGLDMMKSSVESLTHLVDVSVLSRYHPIVYLFAAFVFTAIIQSSSATMMLTLSALNSELIPFVGAVAMVIGADLGTTITAIFGSVKGSANAKRVALCHFSYNLIIDLIAFAMIIPLIDLVKSITPDDPLTSLVLFHSSFNLLGIIIFTPFLGYFARFLESRFTEPEGTSLIHIPQVPISESREFQEALEAEFKDYKQGVIHLIEQAYTADDRWQLNGSSYHSFLEVYNELKEREGELYQYIQDYLKQTEEHEAREDANLVAKNFRQYGIILKTLKDVSHNLEGYRDSDSKLIKKAFHQYQQLFSRLIRFQSGDASQVETMKIELQTEFNHILKFIYESSQKSEIEEIDFVSLLNVNHELSSIAKLILDSR